MVSWLNATWIYIGAVIGAGFASGQEIQSFFSLEGGFIGLLVAGILFTACGIKIFLDVYDYGIDSYDQYLVLKTGRLSSFFRWTSGLFCLCCYCVMMAGANAVVKSFNGSYGGILFALFCFIIFLKDVKGVALVNGLSTPIIIVGMLWVGFSGIIPTYAPAMTQSVLYVSYNMLGCLPVLATMIPYFKKRKDPILAGAAGGIVLVALMLLTYFAVPETNGELPMLDLSQEIGLGGLYGIVLLLSMLTTAVSSGMGFIKTLKIKPLFSNLILLIAAVCLLPFGFATLVSKLYTFFGMISTILIFFVLKKPKQLK